MTDLGLGDGFVAIGNTNRPTAGGRRVTAVSIKGAAGRLAGYHAILQSVIARCVALQPAA